MSWGLGMCFFLRTVTVVFNFACFLICGFYDFADVCCVVVTYKILLVIWIA